jgi:transmembrane sensor
MTAASFGAALPAEEEIGAIREQAAQWIVALEEAGDAVQRERLRKECERWQAGDPRRRRVFEQMQRMCTALGRMRTRRRRRAGVLGLILLGAIAAEFLPWNVWTADYRTAVAEIRAVTLPDGSVAVLNSDSAISVDYSDTRRTVRLERGELMVTVLQDAAGRPFAVDVPEGSATALGTRYTVRRGDGHSVVAVQQSRVRVTPRTAGGHAITLEAGQQARLTAEEVDAAQAVDDRTPDWVQHRLIFNDASLGDVIGRLAAYRRGALTLGEGLSTRGLRFTGVLPADDSDAALALLADALSLQVRSVTPYLVWLEGRDEKD